MYTQNMTAAEVVFLQEHFRECVTMVRQLNHTANETNDPQFKQLCHRMMQDHIQGIQRFSRFLPIQTQH